MQQNARMFPWDEIPDSNLLQSGTYTVQGIDFVEEQSNSGKLMYNASMQVTEPAQVKGMIQFERFVIGSDDDPQAGNNDTWKRYPAKRMKQMFKSAQIPLDPNPEKMAAAYKGAVFMITVLNYIQEEGDYAGSEATDIKAFHKVGELVPKIVEKKAASPAAAVTPAAVAPPVQAPAPAAPATPAPPAAPAAPAAPVQPTAPAPAAAPAAMECTICHQQVAIAEFGPHVEECIKKAQATA